MGLNNHQKGAFTSSTVAFYEKSFFYFFKSPYKYVRLYHNLWKVFRFIFGQLRMTFFHKGMVAEKNNFHSKA